MDDAQQPAALKEIFDRVRIRAFADQLSAIWPAFDAERFYALATDNLDALGIMERMRLVASAFDQTLPKDFDEAVAILDRFAPTIQHGFASISLCEFVLLRGQGDHDRAMDSLHLFTRYGTAEFAIRPFFKRDFDKTLAAMKRFALDDNEHVRRLASEGSRPRLPWSFQLREVVAAPSLTMPILETLRADDSLYVRKSVANHLNDVSKDHPDWLVERLATWPRGNARTEWILKHALRTLVKKGHPGALALLGVSGSAEARVEMFRVTPPRLALGARLLIEANIVSTSAKDEQKIVADYAIHYVKKNGQSSRKVFKLKTFVLGAGASQVLSISQQIRDFSTRSHNAGLHKVELLLNGESVAEGGFDLVI